jgi:hypothetical protein
MSAKLNSGIAVIGIDIGKNSFHVVGLDRRGAIVLRQKWSRGQLETRLANIPPCLIAIADVRYSVVASRMPAPRSGSTPCVRRTATCGRNTSHISRARPGPIHVGVGVNISPEQVKR